MPLKQKTENRKLKTVFLMLFALLMTAFPAQAVTFNAATDFSATINPNGQWSYGYTNTLGSITLYTVKTKDCSNTVDTWYNGHPSLTPLVGHNGTGSAAYCAASLPSYPAGNLSFHPGPNGEYSVIRWTAPYAGNYNINVTFSAGDTKEFVNINT